MITAVNETGSYTQNRLPGQLHVCLVTNAPFSGGVGIYTDSIYRALLKETGKVKLVCTDNLIDEPGVIILNKKNLFPLNHFTNYFINPRRLPKGADIYHIVSQSIGVFARNRPSVVTVHDISVLLDRLIMQPTPSFMSEKTKILYANDLMNRLYFYFARKSIEFSKCADRIIAVSNFTKQELIKYLKVPENKISVVYNGVDHKSFKLRNKQDARKKIALPMNFIIILSVGDEGPRKNIASLLYALQILVRSEVPSRKFALIRVGERTPAISELISQLGLSDRVWYYNKISGEQLPLFYNAADVLVYPSLYEGFGLPLVEAMASGCPIITSSKSSIPEIVKDAAMLVDPLDIEGISDSTNQIISHNEVSFELSQRGLERSLDFSWDECVAKTYKVYESLYRGQ